MKKILLIEDHLEMRENTTEILQFAGYEVVTANNGREGVKKARGENPDLILCDIMMPEMDGYGVLFLLSKDTKTAGVPFLFLTAKSDKSEVRKGMNLGADDYLTKPYEENELLEAIESRLKRSEIIGKEFSNDLDGLNAFVSEARGKQALSIFSGDRKGRKYQRKATLFMEGELAENLYFIISGKVKTWRMNENAKELISGVHQHGDFLGYIPLITNDAYLESATVMEESEIAIIPKVEFLELFNNDQDVAFRFIKLLANNVHEMEEKLLSLAYGTVRSRVAETLLGLRERLQHTQGERYFCIDMSREDLANMVGTSTETVTRTLSELKGDNIVEISGREITLLDIAGLERARQYY